MRNTIVLRTRTILLSLFIPVCLISSTSVTRAQPLSDAYRTAYEAWDAGQYIDALQGFDGILSNPDGADYFERIALLTGELFQTKEIDPWGTAPVWAADGPYFSYEKHDAEGSTTRIVSYEGNSPREIGSIKGVGAQLIAFGTAVAYLKVDRGAEFETRRKAAFALITERTRAAFRQYTRQVRDLEAEYSTVVIRDIASKEERVVRTPGLAVYEIRFHPAGDKMYLVARETADSESTDIYELTASTLPRAITSGPGRKENLHLLADETHALFTIDDDRVAVMDLESGTAQVFEGKSPALSVDGGTIAFVESVEGMNRIQVVRTGGIPHVAYETEHPVEHLAVSPNGQRIVFQIMPRENWELMLVSSGSEAPRQLTHEIQHDLYPQFLDNDNIFSVIGEGRHRRSYLHDVATGHRTRLFHNNTVRTVAPEYEWSVDRTGRRILIVSERDGDTISPERGLYLVDLDHKVSKSSVRKRLVDNLETERRLHENGEMLFSPIRGRVAETVNQVSATWIYSYEKELFSYGSKFITQPGNAKAITYITNQLKSFGYEPELQWFEPRPGVRSANIVATLKGTLDPDIIYVLSSHFDSVERGPGADDNTSGSTALLDAARVLASRPQPSTIQFAFFTGEEAGLLGSREFVRRAVADGIQLVGALNNDMVGFANDNRLDNTIRYSNDGIRDIQHAAAFMFTKLITYDARYYKNTDAHAYYEAYGDIVGGIGSYPILGNPHYHQTHDVLETINHQLVAEVSKTTVATLMLLAASPSRLKDMKAVRTGDRAEVSWSPAVESNISKYTVRFGGENRPDQMVETPNAKISLTGVTTGTEISVRAVNSLGMPGWDWAHMVVK